MTRRRGHGRAPTSCPSVGRGLGKVGGLLRGRDAGRRRELPGPTAFTSFSAARRTEAEVGLVGPAGRDVEGQLRLRGSLDPAGTTSLPAWSGLFGFGLNRLIDTRCLPTAVPGCCRRRSARCIGPGRPSCRSSADPAAVPARRGESDALAPSSGWPSRVTTPETTAVAPPPHPPPQGRGRAATVRATPDATRGPLHSQPGWRRLPRRRCGLPGNTASCRVHAPGLNRRSRGSSSRRPPLKAPTPACTRGRPPPPD